jgi:preprotein translocase SecE subunit
VADKESDKDLGEKTKRRIVKNPETFRERAIKATEQSGKPSRKSRVLRGPGKAISVTTNPVRKAGRRIGRFTPFHILGLILLPRYIRNSWKELRMVSWPTWGQARRLTFAVIVFAAVFSVIIATVDYGLDKLFRQVLLK